MSATILQPGGSMQERLKNTAKVWRDSGRSKSLLLADKAFFLAQCWLYSSGTYQRESAGFDLEIHEFVMASKEALGGDAGWLKLLEEKAVCSHCSMIFHLENIGICTSCMQYVCGACRSNHKNCGGEVVG